jgi:hypothetical protein
MFLNSSRIQLSPPSDKANESFRHRTNLDMDRKCRAIPMLCATNLHVRPPRRDSDCLRLSRKRDVHRSNHHVDGKSRTIRVSAQRHLQLGVAEFCNAYDESLGERGCVVE